MRFAMTAKTVARQRSQGFNTLNELTAMNVRKVTQFRKGGVEALEREIGNLSLQGDEKPVTGQRRRQDDELD